MSGQDVDTRTDIYALGVVLYELLTGLLPFDSARLRMLGLPDIQRVIRDEEPPKPSTRLAGRQRTARPRRASIGAPGATPTPAPSASPPTPGPATIDESAQRRGLEGRTLVRRLKGDLDWVTMKCLEKARARRYASAAALADDLRRYLARAPLEAGPPSTAYRLRKFADRHQGAIIAGALVLLTLVAGAIVSASQAVVATRQRVRAEAALAQAQIQAGNTAAVNRFMRDLLSQASPAKAQGRAVTIREAVDLATADIGTRYTDTPEVEAAIRLTVASLYATLGEYALAEPFITRAVELRRAVLGPEHPDTLEAEVEFVALLSDVSRYTEADDALRKLLPVTERVLGVNHALTIRTLNSLAWVTYSRGQSREAIDVYRSLLARVEGTPEARSPMTMRARAALAMCLGSTGELPEGKAQASQAVRDLRGELGDRHPYTLYARNIESWIATLTGAHEDAVALQRSLLDDARAVYPTDHSHVLYWTQALGWRLMGAKKLDEAQAVFRQSVADQGRVLGASHGYTLESMNGLALALLEDGKAQEALAVAHECRQLAGAGASRQERGWRNAVDTVIRASQALGKAEEAARWRAELQAVSEAPRSAP